MSTSSSFCDEQNNRRFQMVYHIPPPRYDIISPYPTYTQEQLNMRRKAEILKYMSNNQNSKSNGFTKANRWSKIATNAKPASICAQNPDMIPTPTYFSDIPGPIQYLVRDTTIPLYNFKMNTNSNGIIATENTSSMWQITAGDNVYFSNNEQSRLFRISILDKIEKSTYSFQYKTPIAFYLTGDNNPSTTTPHDCSLNITDVNIEVTYGGRVVNLATTTSIDMSSVRYTSREPYRFYFYLGMMTINIENMSTTSGFVYDVNAKFNINTFSLGTFYNINTVGIYANLQTPNFLHSISASTTDISSINFTPYNISGS